VGELIEPIGHSSAVVKPESALCEADLPVRSFFDSFPFVALALIPSPTEEIDFAASTIGPAPEKSFIPTFWNPDMLRDQMAVFIDVIVENPLSRIAGCRAVVARQEMWLNSESRAYRTIVTSSKALEANTAIVTRSDAERLSAVVVSRTTSLKASAALSDLFELRKDESENF